MRNHLWRLLAIVAFGSAITSVSARADDEGYYTFTSALSTPNSSFCLNVPGSDYQPGKRVALIGCSKTPSQIFELANGSNLTAGGLCLDGLAANHGQPPAAGDPVGLAECDGSDHQVWELDAFTSNASLFAIVDPNGLCVTVDGPTAAPGTLLVLAQCAEMQNQGWIQGGAARPIPVRSASGAYVGGYGEYAEPEYYWYSGHRYCWYDGGWHGGGWYWCGENFHNGIGWGGPIGWHFWFHFGHKWLPHPVFFKSYLGKPPHKHDVFAVQKNNGHPGGQGAGGNQGGKGNQGGQAGKGNQGAQGGQGGQGGKGKGNKSVQGGQGAGGGGGGGGGGGAGTGKQKNFRTNTGNKGGGGGGGGNKGGGGGGGNKGGGGGGGGNKGGGGGGGGNKGGGGGGGGGGNKGKHASDIRLKQDIVPLARLDSGIELYRFRYKGSDPTPYVGVMAQQVQTVMPGAVSLGRNGYLQVDYDRLGLKFMTWDTFVQRHGAELRPAD